MKNASGTFAQNMLVPSFMRGKDCGGGMRLFASTDSAKSDIFSPASTGSHSKRVTGRT